MKIAIIGVGAIGGYVGARLAHAGEDVTFIARGANLEALRTRGIRLVLGRRQRAGRIRRSRRPRIMRPPGPQDVGDPRDEGAPGRGGCARRAEAVRAGYVVVPMQNGIPYWYFPPARRRLAGTRINSVDPTGLIGEHSLRTRHRLRRLPGDRLLISPGVVKHVEGNRFPVGEPDGTSSARVHAAVGVLRAGRFAGAGAQRHPCRNMAQALGQSDVQSHQRAVARDARRHLPVSAEPRARRTR
jgi:2-dehydropantoate 2-reductase